MQNGQKTAEFGLWLTEFLKAYNQYSVSCDHGNQQEKPAVAAIKGFFGESVTNSNRLADVDMLVANNGEVILVIEIEESSLTSKKLLGDIFALVMCDRFAVRKENENESYQVSPKTTKLIIAGVLPNKGDEHNKIRDTIVPRLHGFHFPDDSIQQDNIKIVTGKDISETGYFRDIGKAQR